MRSILALYLPGYANPIHCKVHRPHRDHYDAEFFSYKIKAYQSMYIRNM